MTPDATDMRVTPDPTADEAAAIAAAIASIRGRADESSESDTERSDRWKLAGRIGGDAADRGRLSWIGDGNPWVISGRLDR